MSAQCTLVTLIKFLIIGCIDFSLKCTSIPGAELKELIIVSIKSKMAEIHHLENRHDVIFSAEGGPIWIKFRRLVQNDMSTVVMWSKSKPDVRIPIWRTFGRIPWHVIPEPPATLQGAATWWIHWHDSRATYHIAGCSHLAKSMSWLCHIAGCNYSICHIENRFAPYIFLKCSLDFDERCLSHRLWYTCCNCSCKLWFLFSIGWWLVGSTRWYDLHN